MRGLKRNQRAFYYALFEKDEAVKDEDGNETGEKKLLYREPMCAKGNISFSGEAHREIFGTTMQYDGVIALDTADCPIDENTVLFIKVRPIKDEEGEWLYDFIVSKVIPSLNSTLIAVKSVERKR